MKEPTPRERLKTALKEQLHQDQPAKAKGLSLVLSGTARERVAELSFVFLTRVDAVYLMSHVMGGRLATMVDAVGLPKDARQSLAVGLYLKSSNSEKLPRFTSQQGGAEYFNATTNVAELAQRLVSRTVEHYLPDVETILSMTPALPALILEEAQFFTRPLTALAILERLGMDDTFSRIAGTKKARTLSPKESALDIRALVVAKWDAVSRAGQVE